MFKNVLANLCLTFTFILLANTAFAQPPEGCFPFGLTYPAGFGSQSNTTEVCDFNFFRTANGTYNDLNNVDEGKAHIPFTRIFPHSYRGDGSTMIDRGNPRTISNQIIAQPQSIPSQAGLNQLVFTFMQFVDHDITGTEESSEEPFNIQVPAGDPQFDPFGAGQAIIPFSRSFFEAETGTSEANPRTQINTITSWIDASMIYGSDIDRATWLRALEGGKLKASSSPSGPLLPYNTVDGEYESAIDPNAPRMGGDRDRSGAPAKIFVSGDVRASEQPGLTAMHTLFMKEHNRICNELIASGSTDDEFNYQYARKMVGGIIQSIVVYELLPTMGINMVNDSYDPSLTPNISTEFASAAFRLGHTMIPDNLTFVFDDCNGSDFVATASVPLKDAFFNLNLMTDFGPDPILRGLFSSKQETIDEKVVDAARNFLFGAPGAGGMDLAALNIQRGRDHGVADFNTARQSLGLTPVTNFNQISSNPATANALQTTYGNIHNIDLWVGLLAEDKYNGKPIGRTLYEMLSRQFENIIRADRFYFWRDPLLSQDDKMKIFNTRLSDVIKRNTSINVMQSAFYWQGGCVYAADYCPPTENENNSLYIERTLFNKDVWNSGDDNGFGDLTQNVIRYTKDHPNCFLTETLGNTGPTYLQAYIDFNRDGDFTPDEIVVNKLKAKYHPALVRIPSNTLSGLTRMRVISSPNPIGDGCSNFNEGEVEDYSLLIE